MPTITRNRWQAELSSFRAIPTWRRRLSLLREHLFPPASYMLSKYQTQNRGWLPLLYLRRILGGIPKLFR